MPLSNFFLIYYFLLLCICSQYVKELLITHVMSCGEYRSRTDDLLNANQAL